MRALASILATVLFWMPAAVVRAQEEDPQPPVAESRGEPVELPAEMRDRITEEGLTERSELVREHLDRERLTSGGSSAADPVPISLPGGGEANAATPQRISLPNAEGSIEGMGESFSPVLSSGTATFSVPIAVAPGRAGVQPSLALSYSTTGGNGPVGFGWGAGAPFIARQTDRGLPRYVDGPTWHPQEDRFLYNGGQELVPVDSAAMAEVDGEAVGEGDASPVPNGLESWQQYRARVEGGFMRFFRSPDSTRWVVQSKDGMRF